MINSKLGPTFAKTDSVPAECIISNLQIYGVIDVFSEDGQICLAIDENATVPLGMNADPRRYKE
jgi:hypothetical protein